MSLSNGRGDDNPCIFHIKTNKSSYLARTVIIASGLAPKKLNVPGEKKLSGKNIFYYGSPEYAKGSVKNVLIIGGGDAALDSALGFHKKGKNVTVAMRSRVSKSNPYLQKMFSRSNIVLLPEHEVNFFKKDGSKVVVKFANGKKIRCDLVSICAGKQKNFPFLPDDFLANPPAGLYFAGDCARGRDRHIAIACGDGIAAAMKAGEYLSIEGRGTWDERRKNSYRPSS
jgi:thioredoxin reductase (NADPH)